MSIAFPLHMRYDGYDVINRGSDANHHLARGESTSGFGSSLSDPACSVPQGYKLSALFARTKNNRRVVQTIYGEYSECALYSILIQ